MLIYGAIAPLVCDPFLVLYELSSPSLCWNLVGKRGGRGDMADQERGREGIAPRIKYFIGLSLALSCAQQSALHHAPMKGIK